MNHSQLKTLLRKRIGSPSATDVTDAVLSEKINSAYEEIVDKFAFLRGRGRAKFTTVVGQDKYQISSITDEIRKVWDRTNKRELEKIGSGKVARSDFDGGTNARPERYARFENYIQLLPVPDGAYIIELLYRARLTALASDADIPNIPSAWHRGIALLATYMYYDDEAKDYPKATASYNTWQTWLRDKPVEAHEEAAALDSGVEIPSLGGSSAQRLDFDHGS